MRSIAIIGAGQTALLAAHALHQRGYTVRLYVDKSPADFLTKARPTGAAFRWKMALGFERELGIDLDAITEQLQVDGVTLFAKSFESLMASIAAKREVVEETGHEVSVHEFLGSMSYPVDSGIKIVQFWHMRAIGGPVGISVTGLFSLDFQGAPWSWDKFVDLMKHVWLPALVLGIAGTARLTRVMRAYVGPSVPVSFIGCYDMNRIDQARGKLFLDKVRAAYSDW